MAVCVHINYLDIEDIGELLEDLIEVAACWFIVGLLLRVPYHELKAIQKDNRDQSKECLREMLATWLKGSRASPAALVNALRAAGHFVLANKFAVKHGETRHIRRGKYHLFYPNNIIIAKISFLGHAQECQKAVCQILMLEMRYSNDCMLLCSYLISSTQTDATSLIQFFSIMADKVHWQRKFLNLFHILCTVCCSLPVHNQYRLMY